MAYNDRLFDEPLERLLSAECVESYQPGGFHPVDIGDTFQADRYEIVRKLGHGSSSTVWLAQDTSNVAVVLGRYVAIKIIGSKASKASKELVINRSIATHKATRSRIITLLDSFKHVGPNGEHDCLVFEPMGPDVGTCFERSIPYWQGRSIGKQLLTALQCLHDLGIAHSDTNPGNLLLSLAHRIEKHQLSGGRRSISTRIEGKRNPCAPEYIHEDRPLTEFWDHTAPIELKLSDFGAAFPFDEPPPRPVIAVALRAPEVVLQSSFDHRVDIWSFACYLFEVVTGQPLFNLANFTFARIDSDHLHQTKDDNGLLQKDNNNHLLPLCDDNQLLQMNDDDHILQMISTLGPLPPAMFEKWPRRMRYFDANLQLIRTDVGTSDQPLGAIHVGDTLEQRLRNSRPPGMTAEDGADLVHALRMALQYDPTNRPSATELLSLDWFCRA